MPKIIRYLILSIVLPLFALCQSSTDYTGKNSEKDLIRTSGIKSKTIWEYHYLPGNEEAFADSGYKSYYFGYDKEGRMTEYTKYHVFSDLTVREVYRYKAASFIDEVARYNSANEMIKTIGLKYNSRGLLKSENHTAYHNSVRPGVYFSILANINDGELFTKLQEELGIEPVLQGYTININISDADEQNQYVVIGDESDPSSPRYSWAQFSIETQRGLLSYEGPNRKEHTYISKNVEKVTYKHDSKSSLTDKSVINTSNDVIDRESYRYGADNRRTNYYKYNESGKLSSMETYRYDEAGRLVETTGLDPDGKIVSRLQYKYDDGNNLTEKTWLNAAGEINGKFKYTYDGNRITEEIKFRGENEKENRLVYKYDEAGNIISVTKYDLNDKKEKLYKYIYEKY